MNRRRFLSALLATTALVAAYDPARASTTVVAGAIRWDAWDAGPGSSEQGPVQASLGPQRWQFRAPWFATPVSPYAISINGNQQSIMDAEITYAKNAGLNYWAYCWYGYGTSAGTDSYMQNAWALHQSSSIKSQMNWCMLWQFSRLTPAVMMAMQSTFVGYCQQSNYQKVLSGRPLVYLFVDSDTALAANWTNSWANVQTSLNAFRAACVSAGLATPYIIIQYGYAPTAQSIMSQVSCDAISNYTGSTANPATFTVEDTATQAYWATMAATGAPIVPICQTGWDTRPRKQNPPPWGKGVPFAGMLNFVTPGTPAQIAAHIQAAVSYVLNNPTICPSKALLIYSWNECDEGGGALVPAYTPSGADASILNAVAGVLTTN